MARLITKQFCALVFVLGFVLMSASVPTARADGPITLEYFALDDGGVTSQHETRMALARETGAHSIRIALYWRGVESSNQTPENYNWAYPDIAFSRILDGGLIPLVYITENPAWAANTTCGPIDTTDPNMLAEFSEFMGALAARYPQIQIWGLYNESDNSRVSQHTGGCFGDTETGDVNTNGVQDYIEYALMAGAARDGIQQSNPNARVAMMVAFDDFDAATCPPGYPGACPPLSHFDYNFLPKLFGYMAANPRENGQPYADLLALSYYDIYGRYWENQPSGAGKFGIHAKVAAIRERMTNAGVSLPIIVTETGSDSRYAGLDGQSRCLTLIYVRGMAADLQTIAWWTFVDNSAWSWFYGLIDSDNNPKPSYLAYQTLLNELNGWTYKRAWNRNKKAEGYRFVQNGVTKWVLWSRVEAATDAVPCARPRQNKRINLDAKRLRFVDLYGNVTVIRDNKPGDLNPQKGVIGFRIGTTPQYITIKPYPKKP